MACCTESFYLSEGSPLFCRSFGWLLVALAGALLVSFVVGLVGCSKKCYRIIALMSTGVVSKLALIPDVEDDVSDSESEEDAEDSGETNTRRKICQWIKKALNRQQHRTISFKTCDGTKDVKYWVFPWVPMLLLPAALVLILAYVTVFITTQWTLTTECSDDQSGNATALYFNGLAFCPPVNCSAWDNSGELIRVPSSSAFDPFNPLERFVSLLAVQVAVLQFLACVVNKGCCGKLKHPPCRYTLICIGDVVFVVIVITATIVIGTRQIDRADTFEKLTIPFVHLIFVSFAECMVLSIFVLVICCNPKQKETRSQSPSTETNGNIPEEAGSDSETSCHDTDQRSTLSDNDSSTQSHTNTHSGASGEG